VLHGAVSSAAGHLVAPSVAKDTPGHIRRSV
jgi:hypothetical protein